jgi:hypothetical protein
MTASKKITSENIKDLIALSTLLSTAIEKGRFSTKLEDIIPSSLVDISEGGLLLRIQNHGNRLNIPEGTEIEVKFTVGNKEMTLKGTICRRDPESQSYAIQFSDLSMEVKKALKKFIADNIEKSGESQ